MVLRYAFLVAACAAALWAVLNLGASDAEVYLVSAAGEAAPPVNLQFWVLAGIASFITLSLCRFVIFGLPSMIDGWYRDNKSLLYTLLIGGAACAYFYLM
jgi:hypothetical protein